MGKLFGAISGATLGMIGIVAAVPTCGTSLFLAATAAGAYVGKSISDMDKMEGFEKGVSKANDIADDKMNKYFIDFILATTALSYYVARCDGNISEEEKLEIGMDLDAILKNQSIPAAVINEVHKLSKDTNLTFEKVKVYLDAVPLDTLKKFQKDVEEIVHADGMITPEEEHARNQFNSYLQFRKAKGE